MSVLEKLKGVRSEKIPMCLYLKKETINKIDKLAKSVNVSRSYLAGEFLDFAILTEQKITQSNRKGK